MAAPAVQRRLDRGADPVEPVVGERRRHNLQPEIKRRTFMFALAARRHGRSPRAQQADRVRRIGILMSVARDSATEERIKIFQKT